MDILKDVLQKKTMKSKKITGCGDYYQKDERACGFWAVTSRCAQLILYGNTSRANYSWKVCSQELIEWHVQFNSENGVQPKPVERDDEQAFELSHLYDF